MRDIVAAFSLIVFPVILHATTDYFPLRVGNRWVYDQIQYQEFYMDEAGVLYRMKDDQLRYDATDAVVEDSVFANLSYAFVGVRRVVKEAVLEVIGQQEVNGQQFFLMNTGQLLGKDSQGNVVEYDLVNRREALLFDLTGVLPNTNTAIPITIEAVLRPFITSNPNGLRWRETFAQPKKTKIGPVSNVVWFSLRDGISGCGVSLGPNIGVIDGGCGSDVVTEGAYFELSQVFIDGLEVQPTATEPNTWGEVKSAR